MWAKIQSIGISELKWRNFSLHCSHPERLVQCKWSVKPILFVVYRLLMAAYVTAHFCFQAVNSKKFLITLTNWGYCVITINFVIKLLAAFIYFNWIDKDMNTHDRIVTTKVPIFLKISWVLTNLSTSTSIVITTAYWIFVYPGETSAPDYANIQIHAINSVVIVLDLILISIPFRLLHFYQPMLFGASYLIFNLIYWLKTKEQVYSVLDWEKVTRSIIFITLMFLLLVLIHSLAFILNTLLSSICVKTNNRSQSQAIDP